MSFFIEFIESIVTFRFIRAIADRFEESAPLVWNKHINMQSFITDEFWDRGLVSPQSDATDLIISRAGRELVSSWGYGAGPQGILLHLAGLRYKHNWIVRFVRWRAVAAPQRTRRAIIFFRKKPDEPVRTPPGLEDPQPLFRFSCLSTKFFWYLDSTVIRAIARITFRSSQYRCDRASKKMKRGEVFRKKESISS